jgi:hypothetical protein
MLCNLLVLGFGWFPNAIFQSNAMQCDQGGSTIILNTQFCLFRVKLRAKVKLWVSILLPIGSSQTESQSQIMGKYSYTSCVKSNWHKDKKIL